MALMTSFKNTKVLLATATFFTIAVLLCFNKNLVVKLYEEFLGKHDPHNSLEKRLENNTRPLPVGIHGEQSPTKKTNNGYMEATTSKTENAEVKDNVVQIRCSYVDQTVNPCKDYYQFLCGNYDSRIADFLTTVQLKSHQILTQLLDETCSTFQTGTYDQACTYYVSCKKYKASNNDATLDCTKDVNHFFFEFTTSLFVTQPKMEEKINAVKSKQEKIKQAAITMIKKHNALSQESKDVIVNNLEDIRFHIGFYSKVNIQRSRLKNFSKYPNVKLTKNSYIKNKETLNFCNMYKYNPYKYDSEMEEGAFDTTGIMYNLFTNEIFIPAGALHDDILDLRNPSSTKFAKIINIIGHEIGHNIYQTLEESKLLHNDVFELWNKIQTCVSEKYAMYAYDGNIDEFSGVKTVEENFADIWGLNLAYNVVTETLFDKNMQFRCGGMPVSLDKAIIIAVSELNCGTNKYNAEKDVHSPNKLRVNGPLNINPEVYKHFDCRNPTNYNCNIF